MIGFFLSHVFHPLGNNIVWKCLSCPAVIHPLIDMNQHSAVTCFCWGDSLRLLSRVKCLRGMPYSLATQRAYSPPHRLSAVPAGWQYLRTQAGHGWKGRVEWNEEVWRQGPTLSAWASWLHYRVFGPLKWSPSRLSWLGCQASSIKKGLSCYLWSGPGKIDQDGSTDFPSASVCWGLEWRCLGSSCNCVMTGEILALFSRMRRWWAVIVIIFALPKERVIKPQGHLANRHIIHQELSNASCNRHASKLSALLLALVWLNNWGQNQCNVDCPPMVQMFASGIKPSPTAASWGLCCTALTLRTSCTSESEFVTKRKIVHSRS